MKKWMKGWGRRLVALVGVFFLWTAGEAAPGGTLTVVNHPNTYPTPQNLKATLTDDGRNITLQWDGVRWPVDGYPEEVDGKDVPTNFYYEVFCRTRESGATEWSDWWNSDNPGRFDWKTDAFLERVTMTRAAGAGTNYQFRVRCVQYVNPKDPHLLPESERIQDVYSSEYTDIVTAYRTLDKLDIALQDYGYNPLCGMLAINLTYAYASSRADEGEEPLYFTFKAIEVPYPEPGTTPEAPVEGGSGKPYARRDGTPLAVKTLDTCPPDSLDWERVDPTNFTLTAASGTVEYPGEIAWYVYDDLKNYYHTNVTIWVQGWAQPETAGGEPRCVLDEAIGNVTVDTRGVTATPQPDQDSILLTWPAVPGAATYEVWRAGIKESDPYVRIESFSAQSGTGTVMFTDMSVLPATRYKYKVVALDADGTKIDDNSSDPAIAYSRLDVFSTTDQSLYSVQPQTPWNGKVDIVVRYYSARDERYDGTPHFKLIAENYESGESLSVKTLTRADGEVINPNDFTLEDEQNLEQRLVWDAGADLDETLVERLRLTVDCVGVEPYWEGDPVTAWTGSPAKYKENVRLDTRYPRIRKLGQGTHAWVDLDWFPGATKADLYCNGTLIHTTTDEYTRKKTLDNAELNIWGTNELKVVTDTGVTWTGGIAYPAFGFTVSEGNEDGITLTWNTVDDEAVGGYQVRRRVKGSTDAFETVATLANDVTTYTDTTADETGAYEYTVVPRRTWDADIGPVPAAQRGYRSLDKIEIVQERQLYPWTTQVALDVYFASGRDESTDGAVTYKLEAALADGTAIPISNENLRLETVDGFSLDPADILFGSPALPSGKTTRLWWNAPADLGAVQVSDSVVSGIVLRIVPTLADGAPEGAVAAPAPAVKDGLTVDLRKKRTVAPGEEIPVVWEWWRNDVRVEAHDKNVFYVKPEGSETDGTMVWHTPEHSGEGTIEVPENGDLWPSFRLVKREMNTDDTDETKQVTLTSEVLFQMPMAVPQNVQATRGNADVAVRWDAVPYASHYLVEITTVTERGAKTVTTQYAFGTQYTDQRVPELGIVGYKVRACFPNDVTGEPSDAVVGWRTLDKAELTNVSTRRPWNGTVDIDLAYHTARDQYGKVMEGAANLPGKTVTVAVTTADGEAFAVQSLVRETLDGDVIRREKVTNGAFTLGANDRIVWDAHADASRMYEPGSTLKVTLAGDEYSNKMTFEKTFDLDTRTGVIDLPFGSVNVPIPWSTRWAKPEVKDGYLGAQGNVAWWKQTAVLTDITDSANPVEILRTEAKLGEGTDSTWTPKVWGLNTITLILKPISGSSEQTKYAAVFKLPDFSFKVEAANADGVTLKWNALDGAASYEIRRRKAGTSDAFEEITNVVDVTTWTDSTVDTVVGDFEYQVVPRTAGGSAGPDLAPVSGTRGAPQTPQNVVASTNDTNAVTVTWDAVPNASGYEVKVERWDVAINRTTRTVETNEACFVDTELPQPGLGRYTVTAVYPNGMKGAPSEAAVGYAVLDTMKIQGVSTRWPWNGKVDLDVEYKTVRTRFNELFGFPNLPYPTNVTLAAQTAEGSAITVATLEKEPAVDKNHTVNRKVVENGTAIFSGSGWLRLVWDADTDTQNSLLAPGTTLTLTASDDYSSLTDSCTVDIDTTKPVAIPLPEESEENDREIAFPWAARWADEASRSLNMQDGTDLEIVTVTRYGTVTNVVETQTQLADEGGVFTWRPGDYYGVLIVEATFTNRATAASSTYRSKFLRSVATPVTVERVPGQNALDIRWTFSADCTYYQIIRREVYADGTRSPWQNMAPLSGPWYRDIGVVGGRTYEYAACPMYPDLDTHDYITAEPVVWTAGSAAVVVTFDALGPYLADRGTVATQFLGGVYGELPPAAPTARPGYKLAGWTLGVTNGAPEAVEGASLLVPANHTLYARWAVDPAVSAVVDADGNSIFNWEVAENGQTVRILGFRDPSLTIANLVIPDSINGHPVTEIADYAFVNAANGITSLTLPAYCQTVGTCAFADIKTLATLTITPVRVWSDPSQPGRLAVGNYAFAGAAFTALDLPADVAHIGDFAFANCQMLTEVTILGHPTIGRRPFRRAGIAAVNRPNIHLDQSLADDQAYLDQLTREFGTDVVSVDTNAVVTGLSLGSLSVPAPGAVRLSVGVERASTWGEVDVSRLRVVYREQLGDAPVDLVPRAVTHEADGSLTVEVDAPDGASGFFRVKLVK